MEKDKKIDIVKFIIGRFDNYYNGINSKCSFYLTLNTFLIGATVSSYAFLPDKIALNSIHIWMMIALVILAFASICLTLIAVHPYMKSGNSHKYSSLLFFGSISAMKEKDFYDDLTEADLEKLYNDFLSQAFQLANGLNRKFTFLNYVGRLLIFQFLIITSLIISFLTQ